MLSGWGPILASILTPLLACLLFAMQGHLLQLIIESKALLMMVFNGTEGSQIAACYLFCVVELLATLV